MDDMAVGYQGKTLIHDINIGIDKGEIVTLIGPNGSGKSTIFKEHYKTIEINWRKGVLRWHVPSGNVL